MILLACLTDIIVLIISAMASEDEPETRDEVYVTWVILTIYAIDIAMRLYALHVYLFFKRAGNVFDFIVVLASFIIQGISVSAVNPNTSSAPTSGLRGLRAAYQTAIGKSIEVPFTASLHSVAKYSTVAVLTWEHTTSV